MKKETSHKLHLAASMLSEERQNFCGLVIFG